MAAECIYLVILSLANQSGETNHVITTFAPNLYLQCILNKSESILKIALWPQLSDKDRMVGEGVSIRISLALMLLTFLMGSAAARDFSLVGYLPEWRHEGADFDRLTTHLSHLILFSAEV